MGNNQAVAEGQNSTALNAEDAENQVYTVDINHLSSLLNGHRIDNFK
ncbi:MAG: hypothetical protein ACFNUN_06060 [Aggregatibacter sp.]